MKRNPITLILATLAVWAAVLGLVAHTALASAPTSPTAAAAAPAPPTTPQELCEAAATQYQALATKLHAPIVCRPTETPYGGFFAGDHIDIETAPGVAESYYGEAMAHELGHAQAYNLTQRQLDQVAKVLGVAGNWSSEYYADVLGALGLGRYVDYGDGWRHPEARPTEAQVQQLRDAGLALSN